MLTEEDSNLFESYTDLMLLVSGLLIVTILLLSINVNKEFNSLTKENSFTGGSARPVIYIDSYFYKEKTPFGRLNFSYSSLYSPSFALANTTVKDGTTISTIKNETMAGRAEGNFNDAFLLLSFIDPGIIEKEGVKNSFVLPAFPGKQLVVLERKGNAIQPRKDLSIELLKLAWRQTNSFDFSQKSYKDYADSRCHVFFESEVDERGTNFILIGNIKYSIPDAVRSGQLDFLTSLSSSNTEVVYLGAITTDYNNQSNTRIEVLRELGMPEAAEYYKNWLFNPRQYWATFQKIVDAPSFSDLDSKLKQELLKNSRSTEEAEDLYVSYVRRIAVDQIQIQWVRQEIAVNQIPEGVLPPFIAYPEALDAYLNYRKRTVLKPPTWVFDEFLKPLGYNKRIISSDTEQ